MGDGNLDPGEDCDDGNTSNDDCCSAVCQVENYGHPCVDSDPCTANACDGTGGCGILPGCLSPGPPGSKNHGRSLLLLHHDATHETGDRLVWKWQKGSGATTIDDLGDPTSTTQYTVCLYAGTSATSIRLPAGANWQAAAKGFKFKDPSGLPDGAQRALVKRRFRPTEGVRRLVSFTNCTVTGSGSGWAIASGRLAPLLLRGRVQYLPPERLEAVQGKGAVMSQFAA